MKANLFFLLVLVFAVRLYSEEPIPKHFRVELTVTPKAIRVTNVSVEPDYARAYAPSTDAFHVSVLDSNKKSLQEISLEDPLLDRIFTIELQGAVVHEPTPAEPAFTVLEEGEKHPEKHLHPEQAQKLEESYTKLQKKEFVIFVPFDPSASTLRMTYNAKRKITATVPLLKAIRSFCEKSKDTNEPDCKGI